MSNIFKSKYDKDKSRYFKVLLVMKKNGPEIKIYNLEIIVRIQSYVRMIKPKKHISSARKIERFSKKWILMKRFNQTSQGKVPMRVNVSTNNNECDSKHSSKNFDNASLKQPRSKSYKNVLLHLVMAQHPQKFIENESTKKEKSSLNQKKSTRSRDNVTKNKKFEKGKHWCKFGKKCRNFYNHKGFEGVECNFKHIEQAGVTRYPKEHEKCPACVVYKGDCTCCYELLM